ncbi:MAG: M16 family metallopeptidase [Pseudomonadota bacterium]
MFFGGILILCGALAIGNASAATETSEHTLKNGLRVIVKEDHRAPVVASMVWYRAGSIDEVSGTTGVAHVLEHMMFKGTRSVPAGQFSKIIAAAGGKENAFTNTDYTAYFQQLHKSKLPLAMKLEADRMANLNLSDREFAKEIKVVMEERRLRTEDQPHSLMYEKLMAAALQASPYRWPVIGWMDDLEHMTADDARAWYKRWYAPNNAILVVAGDVKPKEVFALAERYYGPLKARPLPTRKPQLEGAQTGIKRITVKAPAELPALLMGYRAPVLHDPEHDWEPYALEVLTGVLDGNPAARLNKALVLDEKLASSVGASYDSVARGPGMIFLDGTPSEGRTVAELEAGIRAQIDKVIQDGVTEEELQRVKAQVVAAEVFKRDSVFYQAMQIGMLEAAGIPHRSIDLQVRKLQEVTADQVREVAKKYFNDDGLTVAVLDPQPLDAKKPMPAMKGMRHGG